MRNELDVCWRGVYVSGGCTVARTIEGVDGHPGRCGCHFDLTRLLDSFTIQNRVRII